MLARRRDVWRHVKNSAAHVVGCLRVRRILPTHQQKVKVNELHDLPTIHGVRLKHKVFQLNIPAYGARRQEHGKHGGVRKHATANTQRRRLATRGARMSRPQAHANAPMNQAARVQKGHGVKDLPGQKQDLRLAKRPPPRLEAVVQVAAAQEFVHMVAVVGVLKGVEERDDVAVRGERAQHGGLGAQHGALLLRQARLVHGLDGDVAARLEPDGAQHGAKRARVQHARRAVPRRRQRRAVPARRRRVLVERRERQRRRGHGCTAWRRPHRHAL